MFFVEISKSSKNNKKSYVSLKFNITQHSRDIQLVKSFVTYFDGGTFYNNKGCTSFQITKFSDITGKIIPFFNQYKVIGVKYNDFVD